MYFSLQDLRTVHPCTIIHTSFHLQCCQPTVFVRISKENRITIRIMEIPIIHPEKRKTDPERSSKHEFCTALSCHLCVLALAFFLSFVPTWRVSVLATAAWSQKENLRERKLRKACGSIMQEKCNLQDIVEFNSLLRLQLVSSLVKGQSLCSAKM